MSIDIEDILKRLTEVEERLVRLENKVMNMDSVVGWYAPMNPPQLYTGGDDDDDRG